MYTARFLWDNRYLDNGTMSSSSAADGYPVSTIQDPMRARRWRSNGVVDEWIGIDLGESRPINAIALIDHNLPFDATITIKGSNFSVGNSDIFALTDVEVWQEMIGYGEDRYGVLAYGGKFIESERTFRIPRPIRIFYLQDLGVDPLPEARYLQILFSNSNTPSEGFFQLGRILAGLYDDFGINFSGISQGVVDDSDLDIAPGGGQMWGVNVPTRNYLSLTFDWIDYLDKYWNLLFMAMKQGLTKPFIADCFPDEESPSERHFGTLYGRFVDLPEFTTDGEDSPFYGEKRTSSVELTIEEAL